MKKKEKFVLSVYLFVVLSFAGTAPAFGTGIDNSGIGTTALSMASAFAGFSDDASAVYYNPSGLGFGENNTWNAQMFCVFILTGFTYNTTISRDESEELVVNPGMFISKKYEKWAIGYGFYIPYAGGGTQFKNFQGAGYTIDGFEAYVAHTPSVAYQFSKSLSVGAGVSVFQGLLESKIVQQVQVESEYEGLAGYGYDIGVLYKPTDKMSFGLVYKSPVPIKMDGEVKVSGLPASDSEIELTVPTYVSFGLGWVVNRKMDIGFDACFMRYGEMDKRTIKTAGLEDESPTYYKDCWRLGIGARYKMDEKLTIMGGFKYTESGTKNRGLDISNDIDTLIPPACDVDLLSTALGFSYNIKDNIKINITGFYVYGFEEEVNTKEYNQEHLSSIVGADFVF